MDSIAPSKEMKNPPAYSFLKDGVSEDRLPNIHLPDGEIDHTPVNFVFNHHDLFAMCDREVEQVLDEAGRPRENRRTLKIRNKSSSKQNARRGLLLSPQSAKPESVNSQNPVLHASEFAFFTDKLQNMAQYHHQTTLKEDVKRGEAMRNTRMELSLADKANDLISSMRIEEQYRNYMDKLIRKGLLSDEELNKKWIEMEISARSINRSIERELRRELRETLREWSLCIRTHDWVRAKEIGNRIDQTINAIHTSIASREYAYKQPDISLPLSHTEMRKHKVLNKPNTNDQAVLASVQRPQLISNTPTFYESPTKNDTPLLTTFQSGPHHSFRSLMSWIHKLCKSTKLEPLEVVYQRHMSRTWRESQSREGSIPNFTSTSIPPSTTTSLKDIELPAPKTAGLRPTSSSPVVLRALGKFPNRPFSSFTITNNNSDPSKGHFSRFLSKSFHNLNVSSSQQCLHEVNDFMLKKEETAPINEDIPTSQCIQLITGKPCEQSQSMENVGTIKESQKATSGLSNAPAFDNINSNPKTTAMNNAFQNPSLRNPNSSPISPSTYHHTRSQVSSVISGSFPQIPHAAKMRSRWEQAAGNKNDKSRQLLQMLETSVASLSESQLQEQLKRQIPEEFSMDLINNPILRAHRENRANATELVFEKVKEFIEEEEERCRFQNSDIVGASLFGSMMAEDSSEGSTSKNKTHAKDDEPTRLENDIAINKWLEKHGLITKRNINPLEEIKYRAMFKLLDDDKNGCLDNRELLQAMKYTHNICMTNEELTEMLARMDIHGNLSFQTFVSQFSALDEWNSVFELWKERNEPARKGSRPSTSTTDNIRTLRYNEWAPNTEVSQKRIQETKEPEIMLNRAVVPFQLWVPAYHRLRLIERIMEGKQMEEQHEMKSQKPNNRPTSEDSSGLSLTDLWRVTRAEVRRRHIELNEAREKQRDMLLRKEQERSRIREHRRSSVVNS